MAAKNKNGKDYYFIKGKPKHENSYCAFLDVLGFSALISESFEETDGNELLRKFHKILSDQIKSIKRECNDSFLYFKSFTDNIILAQPQFSPDLESEFAFIFWSISTYQFQMSLNGFFIRGGLSFGPLFVDTNSVYGPALIEAYNLESKIAVNPMVVLSDDAMGLTLSHVKFYGKKTFAPQNRAVWVNSDGRFFINYLSKCIVEGDESEFIDWTSLKKHRDEISKCLERYYNQPSIFSKYAWLANYHNQFCDSLKRREGYISSVKVPIKKSSVKFKTISQLTF